MSETPRQRPETGPAFAFRSSGLPQPVPVPENARVAPLALLVRADDLIESLIAVVDQLRGDPDFEPSLGAPSQGISRDPTDQTEWAAGGDARDRETDHDFEDCNVDLRGGSHG